MKLDESIDEALRSPEPIRNLRSIAVEHFSRGTERSAVLAVFENARQELRRAGREADEDAVMDVMDFLVGWCSPHMKLEPEKGGEPKVNGVPASSDNQEPIRPTSQDR